MLALADNRGFAAACNAAVRRARGGHVLLLNPDAMLAARALPELLAAARATGAGIVGPRIRQPDGRPELSFGPPVGFLGEAWRLIHYNLIAKPQTDFH